MIGNGSKPQTEVMSEHDFWRKFHERRYARHYLVKLLFKLKAVSKETWKKEPPLILGG